MTRLVLLFCIAIVSFSFIIEGRVDSKRVVDHSKSKVKELSDYEEDMLVS